MPWKEYDSGEHLFVSIAEKRLASESDGDAGKATDDDDEMLLQQYWLEGGGD